MDKRVFEGGVEGWGWGKGMIERATLGLWSF